MTYNSRYNGQSTSYSDSSFECLDYPSVDFSSRSGRIRHRQPLNVFQQSPATYNDDPFKDTGLGIDTYNGGRQQNEFGAAANQSFELDTQAYGGQDVGFPYQRPSSAAWTAETRRQRRSQETQTQTYQTAGSGLRLVNLQPGVHQRDFFIPTEEDYRTSALASQPPTQDTYRRDTSYWNATDEYRIPSYPTSTPSYRVAGRKADTATVQQQQRSGLAFRLPNVPGGGTYVTGSPPSTVPTTYAPFSDPRQTSAADPNSTASGHGRCSVEKRQQTEIHAKASSSSGSRSSATQALVPIPPGPPRQKADKVKGLCEICGKSFTRYGALDRHVETQHGNVHYECLGRDRGRPCTHENTREDKMRAHCRKKHGDAVGAERYRCVDES